MRRVRINGGMREFVGQLGTARREGNMWRVYLDNPVYINSVGWVADDLWEGRLLMTVRL